MYIFILVGVLIIKIINVLNLKKKYATQYMLKIYMMKMILTFIA